MKKFFTNKKGVTILEGLIALGLLALVATGTFGVLLSISRQSTEPDVREEMVYAVEKAHHLLQGYIMYQTLTDNNVLNAAWRIGSNITVTEDKDIMAASIENKVLPSPFINGLCGGEDVKSGAVTDTTPLSESTHNISCLLPAICNRDNSEFTYTVTRYTFLNDIITDDNKVEFVDDASTRKRYQITFNINCNGFTL